jgi:hypothetical protein
MESSREERKQDGVVSMDCNAVTGWWGQRATEKKPSRDSMALDTSTLVVAAEP